MIKPKVLLVQFSEVITSSLPEHVKQYRKLIYTANEAVGYYRYPHFEEIPTWIPIIYGYLSENYNLSLKIVDSLEPSTNIRKTDTTITLDGIVKLINESEFHSVLFSAMDCNVKFINHIIRSCKKTIKFVIGGYCLNQVEDNRYVTKLTSIAKITEIFAINKVFRYNYTPFHKPFIPRVALSTGCNNHCTFCTVPKLVEPVSFASTIASIESVMYTDTNKLHLGNRRAFKLVYIDDKCFGQCDNYKNLSILYDYIKSKNDVFDGFIVQSSPATIRRLDSKVSFPYLCIKYVELGVETFNDSILKTINKDSTCSDIECAIVDLNTEEVGIIANIIIGLPGETKDTYKNTLKFLTKYSKILSHINITYYTKYNSTNASDRDETIVNKSYFTKEQILLNDWYSKELVKVGTKMLYK